MSRWHGSIPPITELVAFDAAHRHQNFTRAGEELHFSQATVSRRIASLERRLGVTLFDRGRYEVRPTVAADSLAATVHLSLDALAETIEALRRQAAGRTRLTIRSDVSLTAAVINPILGELQQRNPGLDIRVLSSFDPIETDDDDFDVGLQYSRNLTSTSFDVFPIADEEVFPVCAPEVAKTFPPDLTVDQLARRSLLHVDYGEPAWVDWSAFLAAFGVDPHIELAGPTFSTYVVCLDLAERGEGVALGWGHTARPRIEAERLVRLPGFTLPINDAVRAYLPRQADPWQPLEDLLTMLRTTLNQG